MPRNFSLYLASAPALLSLFLVSLGLASPHPRALEECYEQALKRSEKIGIADELLLQAHELENQALGSLMPNLTGSAMLFKQQKPSNVTGANIFPATQNTVKLTAVQPLFRGLRDFAALSQRGSQTSFQKFALQDAARQLFYDTATAFYNVLTLQSDEENYRNEISLNQKRLKELEGFTRIGRSRMSEVYTQRANIAATEAQLENIRGQLNIAKEILAFLTGADAEAPIENEIKTVPKDEALASYLSKLEQRSDIKSAQTNVTTFEEGISLAKGLHFPSVDLMGNYYFLRPGVQKDVHWDFSLTLTMPIFQGGAVQSQIRQAVSVSRQYQLLLSQTRRLAEQEVKQFFHSFKANQKQSEKLFATAELSQKNYQTELKDYRNGLVTNLEVLQALTTWQSAKRTWARQQYFLISDYVKLQAATSQRPEIFIESTQVK